MVNKLRLCYLFRYPANNIVDFVSTMVLLWQYDLFVLTLHSLDFYLIFNQM